MPKPEVIGIGQRIRHQRLSLGMTQADLARALGMSSASVSAVESGTRGLTERTRQAYARILGLRPESLIEGCSSEAEDAWQRGFEAGQAAARRALESALAALPAKQLEKAAEEAER